MSDSDSEVIHLAIPTEPKIGENVEVVQLLNTDQVDESDDEDSSEAPVKRMRLNEETENKDCVELDLVNYSLVRCEDDDKAESTGHAKYKLVPAHTADGDEGESNETVYVLDESDVHNLGTSESDFMTVVSGNDSRQSLVIMEYPDGTEVDPADLMSKDSDDTTPSLLAQVIHESNPGPGRKQRFAPLPSAAELLSSPNLRLFIYSCRQCTYKCNSIKELSEHKKEKHATRAGARARNSTVKPALQQCPRCPYKAISNETLLNHFEIAHRSKGQTTRASAVGGSSASDAGEDSVTEEVEVLVCAVCNYSTKHHSHFENHIQDHRSKLRGRLQV